MTQKESLENIPIDLDEFPSVYKEEAENCIPTTVITTPYDDLSTIANDTIGHTVHPWDFEDGQDLPSYLPQNRQHSQHNGSIPKDGEIVFGQGEETQAHSLPHSRLPPQLFQEDNETPSTGFSSYSPPASARHLATNTGDVAKKPAIPREHQNVEQERRRWRCYLMTAAIVGPIISALVVGVTIALILARDDGIVEGQAVGAGTLAPMNSPITLPQRPARSPISSPSISPVTANISPISLTVSPVIAPSAAPIRKPTAAPQQQLTSRPTSKPTNGIFPTRSPENAIAWSDFTSLLSSRLPESLELIMEQEQHEGPNFNAPQFQAADWLVRDPSYFDLPDDRKMQRYAMAVFVFGLNRLPAAPWLNYEINECTWFASRCDENGLMERLDVRTQNPPLVGPLPVEFVLLSGSLTQLYLQNNALTGTIPPQWFDQMNRLQRLQLTRNNLTGSLPSELGLIASLSVLGLGRNQFVGTLPRDWGDMESLRTLGLERNQLVGTIPVDFGRMNSLVELFLDDNFLSGTVPNSLWDLPNLNNVNLSGNALFGTIGIGSCSVGRLHADCNNEITCNCCTSCDDP